MPQRYSNNILGNPYVGLDVEYFDRKALEKQQRHDVARENYSKFVQGVANQSYLDPDARNQYLEQQKQSFEEVLNKHAGNLSAGYQDILGAIEKSKLNPYHNLNKRQIEQSKIQQELVSKYGPEAIDMSNINKPLYKRNSEGNIQWTDPSSIEANVVKADNYSKIIEEMLAQTGAQEFTTQTGITGGSGNPYYLMSRIQKGEVLSPQELMRISSDPSVQKAFLANANTAGIDNRLVPGSNLTYKEMLNNPQTLAQYIYGNIQDKQRNNIHEQKQFLANKGAELATKHRNTLAQIEYQKQLSREPNIVANNGIIKVTTDSYKKMDEIKNNISSQISKNTKESSNNTRDLLSNLGIFIPTSSTIDPLSELGAISNADGTMNKKYVTAKVLNKYGITDEVSISPELRNKIEQEVDAIDTKFRTISQSLNKNNQLQEQYQDYNVTQSKIDGKLYEDYYNNLDETSKNKWRQFGINNKTEFLNKIPTLTTDVDILTKQRAGYLTGPIDYTPSINKEDLLALNELVTPANMYKNKKLEEGISMDEITKVQSNPDKNSPVYKISSAYVNQFSNMNIVDALSNFSDTFGNPLLDSPNVAEYLAKYPDAKIETIRPNSGSYTGNMEIRITSDLANKEAKENTNISLFSGGKELETSLIIPSAEDRNYENKASTLEYAYRDWGARSEAYNFSNENDIREYETMLEEAGAVYSGKRIRNNTNFLVSQNNAERNLEINTFNGKTFNVKMGTTTYDDGTKIYYIDIPGQDKIKSQDPGEISQLAYRTAGGITLANNPKIQQNNSLIQKGMYELKPGIITKKVKK